MFASLNAQGSSSLKQAAGALLQYVNGLRYYLLFDIIAFIVSMVPTCIYEQGTCLLAIASALLPRSHPFVYHWGLHADHVTVCYKAQPLKSVSRIHGVNLDASLSNITHQLYGWGAEMPFTLLQAQLACEAKRHMHTVTDILLKVEGVMLVSSPISLSDDSLFKNYKL